MELPAGLLASMKLMKGVGGRRGEPQGCYDSGWEQLGRKMGESLLKETSPFLGSRDPGVHQAWGLHRGQDPMRKNQEAKVGRDVPKQRECSRMAEGLQWCVWRASRYWAVPDALPAGSESSFLPLQG